MDSKLLLLGATPPLLAILAELFNPISERSIEPQIGELARGLAHRSRSGDVLDLGRGDVTLAADEVEPLYETRVAAITRETTRVATAAVETAAVIPTWISATAGVTAIVVDHVDAVRLAVGVALWIAVSAVMAPYLFVKLRLDELGYETQARRRIAGRCLTAQELLSRWLIIVNLVVIVAALAVAGLPETAPEPAPHIP